jgi:aspartate carbamoyltransferase catalytic subunit
MSGHDLVSICDLSQSGIEGLFELAAEFASTVRGRLELAHDAVMAALFYEPSTRTRMSFEAAMLRLGGQVISMTDPSASSAAKGETLADTVRIVESYTDLIVLRHPCAGAAQLAADFAGIPVINAGDGSREHPTQTLLDLYTIFKEKGRLAGITVALCGDLKHGRTVHSLVQALASFGAQLLCVAPAGLELPLALRNELAERYHITISQYASLETAPLNDCDVLYVTRLQKERFTDTEEFTRLRASYQVSRQTLARAREDAIVLHPLPRVDELDYALDGDPRAAYFRQAAYGVPIRMALIAALLGLRKVRGLTESAVKSAGSLPPIWLPLSGAESFACENPRCITRMEPAASPWAQVRADGARRCGYCEAMQEATCPH